MNKFTTLAALCLFSLMATVSHAEEMKNDGGMMQDNMQSDDMGHSMEDSMGDTMKGDMEEHGMMDEGMSEDSMAMDDDMSMESDHMDTTDSMKE